MANPFTYPGLTRDPNTTIWDPIFKPAGRPGAQPSAQPAAQVEEPYPTVDPLSGGRYPGLTGDPNTTIWDQLFKTPRWQAAQEPPPTVDPLSATDVQRYADIMGVSPETLTDLYSEISDPGLAAAVRAHWEQTDRNNRMRAAWFENWRRFTGGAYQQSADILSAMPRMY